MLHVLNLSNELRKILVEITFVRTSTNWYAELMNRKDGNSRKWRTMSFRSLKLLCVLLWMWWVGREREHEWRRMRWRAGWDLRAIYRLVDRGGDKGNGFVGLEGLGMLRCMMFVLGLIVIFLLFQFFK